MEPGSWPCRAAQSKKSPCAQVVASVPQFSASRSRSVPFTVPSQLASPQQRVSDDHVVGVGPYRAVVDPSQGVLQPPSVELYNRAGQQRRMDLAAGSCAAAVVELDFPALDVGAGPLSTDA